MPSVECTEELEMLESIYCKEVKIEPEASEGECLVSMVLHPATAGDAESRFVTLTVLFRLCLAYPHALPTIELRNPRGVSEEQLNVLQQQLLHTSQELKGSSMLYQLIGLVVDFLTANNRPCSECPICLTAFSDCDVFYTPHCYHHFHSRCLGVYLDNLRTAQQENHNSTNLRTGPPPPLCPVCRTELESGIDIDKLLDAPPPSEDSEDTVPNLPPPSPDLQLQKLFNKQRDQGGIIDLSQTFNRLLVISQPSPVSTSLPNPVTNCLPTTTTTKGRSDPSKVHHSQRHAQWRPSRGGHRHAGHSVHHAPPRHHHSHTQHRNYHGPSEDARPPTTHKDFRSSARTHSVHSPLHATNLTVGSSETRPPMNMNSEVLGQAEDSHTQAQAHNNVQGRGFHPTRRRHK